MRHCGRAVNEPEEIIEAPHVALRHKGFFLGMRLPSGRVMNLSATGNAKAMERSTARRCEGGETGGKSPYAKVGSRRI